MCLLVRLVTLLLLLLTTTSASRQDEHFVGAAKCFNEGSTVRYECRFRAVHSGTVQWDGVGFDCPSRNSAANDVLAINFPRSDCSQIPRKGACGPYSATLTCTVGNDHDDLISVLEFEAGYGMNGGNITCLFRNKMKTFLLRVGVTPNPPSNVRVTTGQDQSCQFHWTPPINESIGGIGGYNISYGENCGNCTPAAGFVNQTQALELTADCSECIGENNANNMCYLEVSTVSEDCSFDSAPVEATSDSPINSPMDSTVSITCSLTPNPPIYVEWIYTFSEESRRAFSGFLITISDQFGHSVEDILLDSKVRSKYFNSTVLKENDGFVGDFWNVTVSVAFDEDRNKFAFDSMQFSVQDTIMLDTSSAVTPRQCIDVSINSHCDEKSDTFRAQVQFIEGTCGSGGELTNSTSNYTLQDYKTCVSVVANTICYSTVIFHNELELGRTERQELVLMPCILETSNSTRLKINSNIGDIQPGIERIPHNTTLYFSCNDPNCTLFSNGHNETRCTNGTFQPDITSVLQDGCRCPGDLPLWSKILIGVISGSVLVIVGCSCFLYCCYRRWKQHGGEPLPQPDLDDGKKDYFEFLDGPRSRDHRASI